jgi:ABC-type glycerol-3-phosphate transport system permease component
MSAINELVSFDDPRRALRRAAALQRSELLQKVGLFTLTLFLAVLFAFPFYWLIRIAGVWPSQALVGREPSLIIGDLSLYNFVQVYYAIPFAEYATNSIIVSAIAVVSQLILCSLAAYGLSMDFYGKKYAMGIIILAMMVPFQTIFLTDYLITSRLGLVNSYLGLAIVVAVSVVNILVLKSAFEAVPDSMADAARLDGASELYILFGVYWPLSKAALVEFTASIGCGDDATERRGGSTATERQGGATASATTSSIAGGGVGGGSSRGDVDAPSVQGRL